MHGLCERLLVPVDGSDTTLAVGHRAIQLAKEYGSQLRLIFVVDESVRDLLARMSRRPVDEVQREMEATGRRTLNHLARLAEKESVPVEKVLRSGALHAEVVAEAELAGATLVVIGKPVERELRGLYLDRVFRQIVDDACCPVLVLKPAEQGATGQD